MTISLTVDGKEGAVAIRSVDRLSDVLRDHFGIAGMVPDCRAGRCGRCLVFMDGLLVPSCTVPAFRARGLAILTFEGFSRTAECADIVAGFRSTGLHTCGFCDAGRIMAAADLLERDPMPSATAILEQMDAVQCRCSDPDAVVAAVSAAATIRTKRKYARAGE